MSCQLKSLGKPILGLINVKSACHLNGPDWDIDLEDLQEKLADTSTINSIVNQFKAFDKKHNQDWSNINLLRRIYFQRIKRIRAEVITRRFTRQVNLPKLKNLF
ncbi:MAG: hypothetical protein IJS81_01215 [Selenomonadaceae bacterium]|nr:hypothetical protein [Selenomonadaceae bacterium]